MSKSKVIWVVLGSLVLIAGLVTGVMLVSRNQDLRNRAAPATSFSITPSSQNKTAGESFNFAVVMDTGQNQVSGMDIVINFDPQVFQVDGINKGGQLADFIQIISSIDSSTGKISYSAYTADPTKALNGSNISILTVAAQVKSGVSGGTYDFTFHSSSAAAGLGEGQNVLTGTTLGSVVVAGATSEPTATPTSTPTQAPGGTPTPTPTSGSGATPTPTPTRTPTPTATSAYGLGGGSLPTSTPVPTQAPIPVSGVSSVTIMGIVIGAFAVIGSLLLAL